MSYRDYEVWPFILWPKSAANQMRTNTTTFNEGSLMWKKGYFVNSKNLFLDINKKPISNLYRVFSTFPWW